MNRKGSVAEMQKGYNVNVTGRHVHITQGMKDHAIDKISKLDHIGDRIIDVNVTMDIQKLEHRVDILMKYGHTIIRSEARTTDMYASIDKAVQKLESQLKRYKDKLQHHHIKAYPVIDIPVGVYAVKGLEGTEEIDEEELPIEAPSEHRLVSTETRPMKILSEEEAIMKMELSGDPFMIFRSEKDRKIKVIYRREDENYGIIEPE